jgi:hypothetical protein
VLLVVIALWLREPAEQTQEQIASPNLPANSEIASGSQREPPRTLARRTSTGGVSSPEEVVARKLVQFARNRRDLVHTLARRYQVEVPEDVERFFDAVEAGRWDEMKALYEGLREQRKSEEGAEKLGKLWPALLETLGVAEAVQEWPAQKLLDYGQSILGSLRPGMVYVGGTDPGRFIPTLLNETSSGEHHIVMTQNAFADRTYLDYVNFLYGDRFGTLTGDDSQRAFQDYLSDAQKRLQHDQRFPDEPKQVRPGEDIRWTDNRIQVSGQVAVMAINEKLLRMMMEKNPEASFAIEQSFPFTSLYGESRPLGPIMELRAQDGPEAFSRERVDESVDYWKSTANQLLASADGSAHAVGMTYGKMAAEQAALLLHHGFTTEAEQTFRLATEMGPASPEAVFRYVNLLTGQKRFDEAIRIAENAIAADVEKQHDFARLAAELNRMRNQ